MATQAAVLNDVRSRLDEAVPRFWDDAELLTWINEAARDIARRAEVLQATSTISVTAGDAQYTMPTDMIRVYRVIWTATGSTDQQVPLQYEDFNALDSAGWTWTNAQGWPSVFTLWGYPPTLEVVLYPQPSVNGTLTVYYYKMPTDLAVDGSAASSTVPVPSGWEDLVVTYCEMIARRKDADPKWTEAKATYEQGVAMMVDRTRRWTDQAGAIQHNNTWLPAWLYDPDWG